METSLQYIVKLCWLFKNYIVASEISKNPYEMIAETSKRFSGCFVLVFGFQDLCWETLNNDKLMSMMLHKITVSNFTFYLLCGIFIC